jgi:hypothetical protein
MQWPTRVLCLAMKPLSGLCRQAKRSPSACRNLRRRRLGLSEVVWRSRDPLAYIYSVVVFGGTDSKAAEGVTTGALPCPPYVPLIGIVRVSKRGAPSPTREASCCLMRPPRAFWRAVQKAKRIAVKVLSSAARASLPRSARRLRCSPKTRSADNANSHRCLKTG